MASLLTMAAAIAMAGTPASGAPASALSLTSISFGSDQVDASTGDAVVPLTWTIGNSDADADDLWGVITLRQRAAAPGEFIGQTYRLPFRLGESWYYRGKFVSGTAQASTYEYQFPVPRYATGTSAEWVVTEVSASADDAALTVTDDLPTLRATTLADTTPPQLGYATLEGSWNNEPVYAYVKDDAYLLLYTASPSDYESGFSHGAVTVTGPGGQTATGTVRAQWFEEESGSCGNRYGGDIHQPACGIIVLLPAHAATGEWNMSGFTLTDNAGNTTTVTGLVTSPINVTANDVVSVRSITATPNPVNNWHGSARTTLTLAVDGALDGIATVRGGFEWSRCQQFTATPTAAPDGTVSVPILMYRQSSECVLTSLIVTDGAGNVAVYGTDHHAPATGLTIARLPNTTPPTAAGFTLSRQTFTQAEVSSWSAAFALTATVTAPVAPVDGYDLYVILADGSAYPLSGGGTSAWNGQLQLNASLPSHLTPGTYRLGLRIGDAGGLSSAYNLPWYQNNTSVMDGSLSITVTP
jgi:hypothetical protein